MESPTKDIQAIIHSLTQGDQDEQKRTLEAYFTRDVSFAHPYVRITSWTNWNLPFIGDVDSRWALWMVYRWYKWLSPTIRYKINSVAYDSTRMWLYVNVRQTFSLWFNPFFDSPVELVVLLKLRQSPANHRYYIRAQEDHYQPREAIKFFVPGGHRVIDLVQSFMTGACMVYLVIFLIMGWAWHGLTRRVFSSPGKQE